MSVTVSVAELRESTGVRLLDVRWRLGVPDGRPAYREGHLPGAVYVDLESTLAAHGGPGDGRHPLPDRAALQDAVRSWGLADGDPVVVYDDWDNLAAGRAWWVLRNAGIENVRLLDGGLAAWKAAGLPLESGDVTPEPGTATLVEGRLPTIDIDQAATWPGVLLDARAGERYRGEVEPIDPKAGHIPGAVNAPTGGNLAEDGTFLGAEALRARFAELGVKAGDQVAVYCGSGVTAAHTIAALRIAGIDAALYPGSWSQWSNHPDRPVATGDR
ncbi:sulfurtransferase [Saccharothrix violaceirubra]|uniref:Thiosulfate/3-mercaptopyruvate sulfurtransferase n=1 Tax=Saccharothrix violaceirubra TaxID=413306 RepID=A0A7W7T3W5_9PSEU|nr:sulfurtransferase [Saccharothrix violaceirubra]MBB4966068.1 thiosulfate/3-mercaptopyruvate sulfurtransferase [Saccharothrix violaceirubra]